MSKYFVFVVLVFVLYMTGQYLFLNTNQEVIVGRLSDTTEKVSGEDTQYIVSIQTGSDISTIEPFEIGNNIFLGRLDRTTVYSQLKELAKTNSCIEASVYGVRVPSLSFRGISEFTPVACR